MIRKALLKFTKIFSQKFGAIWYFLFIYVDRKLTGSLIRPQASTLKILLIMLLSSAQKLPIMLNIIPITIVIMPQIIHSLLFLMVALA